VRSYHSVGFAIKKPTIIMGERENTRRERKRRNVNGGEKDSNDGGRKTDRAVCKRVQTRGGTEQETYGPKDQLLRGQRKRYKRRKVWEGKKKETGRKEFAQDDAGK